VVRYSTLKWALGRTKKHYTQLEKLSRDKNIVKYSRKCFITLGPAEDDAIIHFVLLDSSDAVVPLQYFDSLGQSFRSVLAPTNAIRIVNSISFNAV
jgi:hypothetical protein